MGYFVVLMLCCMSVVASSVDQFIAAAITFSAAGICFVLESKK